MHFWTGLTYSICSSTVIVSFPILQWHCSIELNKIWWNKNIFIQATTCCKYWFLYYVKLVSMITFESDEDLWIILSQTKFWIFRKCMLCWIIFLNDDSFSLLLLRAFSFLNLAGWTVLVEMYRHQFPWTSLPHGTLIDLLLIAFQGK